MVKSVKVPQKYFLCLGVVKSNNIGNFCKGLPVVYSFTHPDLKRKGTSKVALAFHENITWLELVISTPGKQKQYGNYGRKITAG